MVEAPHAPSSFWLRVALLVLVVAALALPINSLPAYAVLALAALVTFCGAPVRSAKLWLLACGIVALSVLAQQLWPAPRIDEGDNIFITGDHGGALERGLPPDAYRQMAAAFDARYPVASRCDPATPGCWRNGGGPDRAYAFSADGVFDRGAFSRRIGTIDLGDPVWWRLGFINEAQYNWGGASDVRRNVRAPWWSVLHPWRLLLPHFHVFRFPAAFAGSTLCWQGLVLWEGDGERFAPSRHDATDCRPIDATDIGRRIYGVAIDAPLSMTLQPPGSVTLWRLLDLALKWLAAGAAVALLVRCRWRDVAVPGLLVGLSLLVVFLHDSSFIGGLRPFDAGDDGLIYESFGRRILQHLVAGDYGQALRGGESVYYYGGPGLRYFRAIEHLIFGDSFLGYLSLMLALPFVLMAALRRFLTPRIALALTVVFIAIPVGAVFGTTYFQYVKWAARGFADPAAATLFLGGVVMLMGPDRRFAPALGAGLLFALALWVRPNLAPGAAVMLGGMGLMALWQMQWRWLAGLCIGFAPVFGMALHNWVFGHVLVPFSSNATEPANFPTPPSVYAAAFGELARLHFTAGPVRHVLAQIAGLLSGPSELRLTIPLGIAGLAILIRMILRRAPDPRPRLIAGAALALLSVGLFYPTSGRYHDAAWLLTLIVCAVWVRDEGFHWLARHWPRAAAWIEARARPLTAAA